MHFYFWFKTKFTATLAPANSNKIIAIVMMTGMMGGHCNDNDDYEKKEIG